VGFKLNDCATVLIDFALGSTEPTIAGTPCYYAPEQLAQQQGVTRQFGRSIQDELAISSAVDIWALGCVLFEVYTGQRLFDQNNDTRKLATIYQNTL